jgi:hypothetical protein
MYNSGCATTIHMAESAVRVKHLFFSSLRNVAFTDKLLADGAEDKATLGKRPEHRLRGQDQTGARLRGGLPVNLRWLTTTGMHPRNQTGVTR